MISLIEDYKLELFSPSSFLNNNTSNFTGWNPPQNSSNIKSIDEIHSFTKVQGKIPFFVQALLIGILLSIQSFLLHPIFKKSKCNHFIRLSISPITIIWLLSFPFRFSSDPMKELQQNLVNGLIASYLACKSFEWSYFNGPYYIRNIEKIDGIDQWTKRDLNQLEKKKQEDSHKWSVFQLFCWNLKQILSVRGSDFSWGPSQKVESKSFSKLLLRFYKVKFAHLCAVAFIIATRDYSNDGKPINLLIKFGIPNVPGLNFLAENMLTFSFGIYISSQIDGQFTGFLIYLKTLYNFLNLFNLPIEFIEYLNPNFYPFAFDSAPHLVKSVKDFWRFGWHNFLMRLYVACGAKPFSNLSKRLGFSTAFQMVFGLLGAFLISGLQHEYLMWVMTQAPHPNPHRFTSFPCTLFFILQPLAIIIEPFIIPLIPKKIGGGILWVWVFVCVSATPFRKAYFGFGRLDHLITGFENWNWVPLLIPGFKL